MDDAKVSPLHWKIMFISGMGFFTDAYNLFIIGVVMALLKPMWHVGKLEESMVGRRPCWPRRLERWPLAGLRIY
ncbi:MAG: hypothetical protein WBQ61_03875 [Candidatus Acidiferrum sp.]